MAGSDYDFKKQLLFHKKDVFEWQKAIYMSVEMYVYLPKDSTMLLRCGQARLFKL